MKGDGEESQTKLSVLGKASLNLPEVAATVESQVERKVPITSKVGGLGSEATLSVISISMSDLNSSHFKQRNPQYNPIFCSGVREFGGGQKFSRLRTCSKLNRIGQRRRLFENDDGPYRLQEEKQREEELKRSPSQFLWIRRLRKWFHWEKRYRIEFKNWVRILSRFRNSVGTSTSTEGGVIFLEEKAIELYTA